MSSKRTILTLLIVSSLGWGVGFIFSNAISFGLCTHDQYSCRDVFNNIGDPLFYSMPALAFIFLILLFTPRAFPAWKKFAIWFVPLAALLFAFYPGPGGNDLFSPYPEQVFRWVSILYVIISILIIVRSSLRNKTQV